MKNIDWHHIVTRETSLYERCLRILGYRQMFGKASKYKISKILVVSRNCLNEQYFDANEQRKNDIILLEEFRKGVYRNIKKNWSAYPAKIKKSLRIFTKFPIKNNYSDFLEIYKYGRAIVLYTEELARVLNEKGEKTSLKELGRFHETAETETSLAWDKVKKTLLKINLDAASYTPDELSDFISRKVIVKLAILKKRKKYYVMLAGRDFKIYYGKEARTIEKKALGKDKKSDVSEIKGQVAYKGFVIGKVRIVNTVEQIRSMKKGEVLISIMTTPRLTEAFKKASAVVTDEGGVICHAAIVAREMKKPCIIGTKIATKVLKDGDLIEVNANEGVVKILK